MRNELGYLLNPGDTDKQQALLASIQRLNQASELLGESLSWPVAHDVQAQLEGQLEQVPSDDACSAHRAGAGGVVEVATGGRAEPGDDRVGLAGNLQRPCRARLKHDVAAYLVGGGQIHRYTARDNKGYRENLSRKARIAFLNRLPGEQGPGAVS